VAGFLVPNPTRAACAARLRWAFREVKLESTFAEELAMQTRRRFLSIVGVLAIGLSLLQPPSGVAAEEQQTEESAALTVRKAGGGQQEY
jgi:hypothetical protein